MKNNFIFFTLALTLINCVGTICIMLTMFDTQSLIINRNYSSINKPLSKLDLAEEINLAKPGDTLVLSYDDNTLYLGFYHNYIIPQTSDKLIILK